MKLKFGLMLALVFAALLAAGCVATAPPADPVVGSTNPVGVASWWGSWQWLAAGGLFLSLLVVALVYMFATALRKAELVAWCKVEIYQIGMTALVLGGFIGIVWFIASVDTSILGLRCDLPSTAAIGDDALAGLPAAQLSTGTGCNSFDLAISYMKWMRERTWIIYNRFLLIYQKYAFQTSTTYGAALGGVGPVLQPMSWLQPVVGYTTVIENFVVTALLLIMVQIELMRYIQFGMLNIILPIGIVCRCFSPFRDFGGALMGMAIALFIFYPLTFALNFAVILPNPGDTAYQFDEIEVENLVNTVAGSCVGADACSAHDTKTACEAADGCQWDIANTIDARNLEDLHDIAIVGDDTDLDSVMTKWTDFWYRTNTLYSSVSLGRNNFNVSHVILGALVLPLLNFIIIIMAARELSRFLGEEIDISNLTRIV